MRRSLGPSESASLMPSCPTCQQNFTAGTTLCPSDGSALLDDLGSLELSAPTTIPEGTTIGEYRIELKIGEGGFGAVYRARHPLIGKTAAVKVLSHEFSTRPDVASRFVAEARAVNQIQNKNIVDIFSFGTLPDGRLYYIMELLHGEGFDAYLERHEVLDVRSALPIFRAVARALDAAHAKGIYHRDLKPENVFLKQEEDGTVVPKLLDFGIAKLTGDTEKSHRTRTGVAIGTPSFMSPEQSKGEDIDGRTDVYAFGVLVYLTLTGTLPFTGNSTVEVLMKQIAEPAKAPSTLRAGVPAAVDAPILAMMAKNRDERPATVGAALDSLCIALGISPPTSTTSVETAATLPPAAAVGGVASQLMTAPTLEGGRLSSALSGAPARTEMNMEAPVPKKRGAVLWGAVALALLALSGGGLGLRAWLTRGNEGSAHDGPAAQAGVAPATSATNTTSGATTSLPTLQLVPSTASTTPPPPSSASATATAAKALVPPPATKPTTRVQHKDIPTSF